MTKRTTTAHATAQATEHTTAHTTARPGRGYLAGAATGVISAGVLFAVAEFLAAFFNPLSSPLTSVGATFIDFTPAWLKDFAIATFGTNDKTVLLLSMAVAAAVFAAVVGIVARRRLPLGSTLVLGLALVMIGCVITRAGAAPTDLIPVGVGSVAGLLTLSYLTRSALAGRSPTETTPVPGTTPSGPDTGQDAAPATLAPDETGRRTFLVRSLLLAGAAVVVGVGGNVLASARSKAGQLREALTLPAARKRAVALPAGVQAPIDGLGPFVTPNDDFYRIDTALVVPQLDPSQWSLRVHGQVENEFRLSFDELLAADLQEAHVTLTCVSNEVGGNLVGNATWLGYPLREVLARAKPLPGADMVLSTSSDGFSASTPLEVLQDDRAALLAVGMNGEPLPLEHGFPVRMVVPGLYGFVSATKWVVDLEVTTFAEKEGYWTSRGWSSHGPIKMSSRVEVPRALARVPAGTVAIGGTAWAQQRGLSKVELQLDDGPWREATLAAEATIDTWRQWSYQWEGATPGTHKVRVRAYDAAGTVQIQESARPAPDGSSGWHTLTFTVT